MKNVKWLKMINNKRGSIAVITAIILLALLIATAFVVDFGIAYLRAGELQNVSDSAALAAASVLPIKFGDSSAIQDVKDKAVEYLEKNFGGECTADVQLNLGEDNLYTSVTVNINKNVDLYIAPVIGIKQIDLKRSATAQVSPTMKTNNIVPLCITEESLNSVYGTSQTFEIKFGASSQDVKNGAFGVVDLDGSHGGGANNYEEWLADGYQGTLSIGDVLPIEKGNLSGSTMDGFTERYNSCTHFKSSGGCTIDHYVEYCPRVAIVPVVQYDDKNKQVTIKGFAAIILKSCLGNGSKSYITGTFVKNVIVNGDGLSGNSTGFGVFSILLAK